jgi:hypothetical protein
MKLTIYKIHGKYCGDYWTWQISPDSIKLFKLHPIHDGFVHSAKSVNEIRRNLRKFYGWTAPALARVKHSGHIGSNVAQGDYVEPTPLTPQFVTI